MCPIYDGDDDTLAFLKLTMVKFGWDGGQWVCLAVSELGQEGRRLRSLK